MVMLPPASNEPTGAICYQQSPLNRVSYVFNKLYQIVDGSIFCQNQRCNASKPNKQRIELMQKFIIIKWLDRHRAICLS